MFETNDFSFAMNYNQNSVLKGVAGRESGRITKVSNIPLSESVFASDFIERGSLSDSYKTENLISYNPCGKVSIRKASNGIIKPAEEIKSWIRSIKLSPDVYSYNCLIELNAEKRVHIRTCKDVTPGEELVVWFSEEISLLMNIPFLTPSNIIDNKCYSCHLCKTSFESPNPLKIHLAVACGRHNINSLWMKLNYSLNTPKTHFARGNQEVEPAPLIPYAASEFSLLPLAQNTLIQPTMNLTTNTAAQIEAIVSNMGTSKQGHLCIYCGKIYSRKYGLKIHIRTHTGFKPLKCKFCLRPFGDPSNLNKHVRLHIQAGNSMFKCHLCQKVLVRRRDLQRHLHTRHNDQKVSKHHDAGSSSEDC